MEQGDLAWLAGQRIVDIDLGGDRLRQHFARILPEWATWPPFYVLHNGHPQLVCCRYTDVVEVLEDSARFSTVRPADPAAGGFVQFKPDKFAAVETLPKMEGERHGRIRRLIAPAFSAPAVQRLEDGIDRALDNLIEAIPVVDGRFDLMPAFARELMVVALLDTVLRLDGDQKAVFIRMNRALPLTAKARPGEPFPEEYHAAFAATTETIDQLIAARRARPGADLLSQLILTRDGSDLLSDKELFDLIFTFSAAALESTAASMGAIVLTLCRHPAVLAEVRARPALIPSAVEEALRLHGPGYFIVTRYALVDTEIGGVPVPRGMPVYVSPQAASYDPERYPDPLVFDLDRPNRRILTFGGGIHFCAGSRLARLVLHRALDKLLARFPRLRLAEEDFAPRYFGAASEAQLVSLPLAVD
ncbi:MAG: cytochrome P450 [Porticoccaceae bacterium]|jgi:cytochrome P450|nr:cytochrome P450 [Porticoccaceae bacterium]MEA3300943.1 cytochrome P450 [Pseudomonadota bacterium]HLS97686.1 cytochrome P450 [Porticoccaceae bacterium]